MNVKQRVAAGLLVCAIALTTGCASISKSTDLNGMGLAASGSNVAHINASVSGMSPKC